MRSLAQSLVDTDAVRLKAIAQFWDIELTVGRPSAMAAQLAEGMNVPATVQDVWDVLPDEERGALEALLSNGGQAPMRVFTREWGEIRAMGSGAMEREQPWLKPVSPAEGLWYKGFIFAAFEQDEAGFYEVVLVPPELQRILPVQPAGPPTLSLEPVPQPVVIWQSGDALLDDACTLLAFLQTQPLRPGPDGAPLIGQANLLRQLRDPDPARLTFLHQVIEHGGWLRMSPAGHVRPEPVPTTAWLQLPSEPQRAALAQMWRDDPAWNDLAHVPSLMLEDTGGWRNDPLLARQALLGHLRACSPGAWYRLDELIAGIKHIDPDFQRPDGDYATWYIREAASGEYLSGFESWDAIEGALIAAIVAGPLAWLGLVDLAAEAPSEAPDLFRLTPAGAVFLELALPTSEQAPPALSLQSDFTVLAPAGRRYDRFQLARVADWVKTADPYIYRFTPASLERARKQGISVARVLEFLERVTAAPVPRQIGAATARWEANGAEVRLEPAVLLRVSTEELMSQVMASPLARPLIDERISPTVARVAARNWRRLVEALGQLSLLPNVLELEETDAD